MIFLALPGSTYTPEGDSTWTDEKTQILEDYFVEQIFQLTKYRGPDAEVPRTFKDAPPEDMVRLMDEFFQQAVDHQRKSGCKVKVMNPKSSSSRTMESFYFTPIVLNHVREAIRAKREEWEPPPLEGYAICFNNEVNENFQVQMLLDIVMVSDDPNKYEIGEGKAVFASTHLTPLAEQLSESINAANSVLREMHYMDKREQRMRLTADSINSRVKYFSYISVTVLVVVTYVQVSYLKRYFRKKKLMWAPILV